MEAVVAKLGGFGGGVEWAGGRWRPDRPVRWRAWWSTTYGQLSRSELNLYLSVHGWRSDRWVLGVCGSVRREGWAEIFKCVMSVSTCEDCMRSVKHLKVK